MKTRLAIALLGTTLAFNAAAGWENPYGDCMKKARSQCFKAYPAFTTSTTLPNGNRQLNYFYEKCEERAHVYCSSMNSGIDRSKYFSHKRYGDSTPSPLDVPDKEDLSDREIERPEKTGRGYN